jgi:phosphoribosylformylglycinamidine cyclo-ligase
MSQPDPYALRGVSSSKEDVHRAISALPATAAPGAFCQVVTDPLDPEFLQVIHADGAGSKSSVAYLAYKESGNAAVFEGIAQDSLAMNIDDMLCVGACDNYLISNTVGRNAHRIGGDIITHLMIGYARSVQNMRDLGIRATLCGGETADIGDLVKTLVVDSTIYSRIPRDRFIDCSNISQGNVIVGFSSSGKASYENAENSGIGSNGFTVAKHVLLSSDYGSRYPESYSETIAREHVYGGPYRLSDLLPGSELTVGEALLSPTRTYAPLVKSLCDRFHSRIAGIIHCTGGGLTKSLKFGSGLKYIKDDLFPLPAIFSAIKICGSIPYREMWKVFNCGHRLEVYCAGGDAPDIIRASQELGIDAKIIGFVEASSAHNSLTISHDGIVETY